MQPLPPASQKPQAEVRLCDCVGHSDRCGLILAAICHTHFWTICSRRAVVDACRPSAAADADADAEAAAAAAAAAPALPMGSPPAPSTAGPCDAIDASVLPPEVEEETKWEAGHAPAMALEVEEEASK